MLSPDCRTCLYLWHVVILKEQATCLQAQWQQISQYFPSKIMIFVQILQAFPIFFFFFLVWKSISILSNPVQISQPRVELTYHRMIVWRAQKCIKTTWLKILACIRKWSVKCKYVIIRNNIYVIGCLTTKLSNTKGVRVLWLVSLHGIEKKNVLWADFAFFIQIQLPITSVSPPSPGV